MRNGGGMIEPDEGAFCKGCGALRLEETRMIYKLLVFCGNKACADFIRGIWVDRAIYEMDKSS